MRDYYLYLDESGNFKGQSAEPSIVAGFLTEQKLSEDYADKLMKHVKENDSRYASISIEPFHAMEERSEAKGDFIADVLEQLSEDVKLVSFKNERGFAVVNSDITYLNVFAAGIVRLLTNLAKENEEEFCLKVLYAKRIVVKDKELNGRVNIIGQDNYQERIEERLILLLAQLPGDIKRRIHFELKEGSARKSKLLMLADVVCFALRGGRASLTAGERERIRAVPCLKFDVMENDAWTKIKHLLATEQISEALYLWYGVFSQELGARYGSEFNELLIGRLTRLSYEEQRLQYAILVQDITRLVNARQFSTAVAIIGRLTKKLFPLLRGEQLGSMRFELGIHFLRLDIAARQGDTTESDRAIAAFKRCFQENEMTVEMMGDYISFKLREISHLKNIFAFQEALAELAKLEIFIRKMLTAISVATGIEEDEFKSETLCRVLTSRAFTWCCLYSNDKSAKAEVINNVEEALAELPREAGGERQYMLRSRIEYLSGNMAEALEWLKKAVGRKDENLMTVIAGDYSRWVFALMHYANIMADAVAVDSNLADRLYSDWQQSKVTEWLTQQKMEYPLNLIWWKLGSYRAQKGEEAAEEFERAIEYSFQNIKNYTIYSMGLAAAAEFLGRLPAEIYQERVDGLVEAYNHFKKQAVPASMKRYFAACDEGFRQLSKLNGLEQQKKLLAASRQIPIL